MLKERLVNEVNKLKNMITDWWNNQSVKYKVMILLVCVFVLCVFSGWGTYQIFNPSRDHSEVIVNAPESIVSREAEKESDLENQSLINDDKRIMVDVKGAIKRPGVYELESGQRVSDAIVLAGGFLPTADQDQINLAQMLADQSVLYVPHVVTVHLEENEEKSERNNSMYSMNSQENSNTSSKVRLNQATVAELQTLPGIGPKRAEEIINYREANGLFKSIDDLKNISGIGPKTFERLKEGVQLD
ncbi:helix-hairpin-helix domain-containing protein [Atopobacter phocae]|uniref:helix-hairpin-helix domain-containing protein n=1 Tax=Atopobacter phocae TaxID=136492 RepID=UPI00046E8E29|nr:helix-hairpin-helix domain-containing protein [Atopobacter phocae]